MSYTNSTTHYALPLPTGSDKSLFTDTNQAFQDIDAAIYSAETISSQAATNITAIKSTIVNLQNADITFQNDISGLKGRMTAVEGVASQNTIDIADVRTDAKDMITAHNEPTATSQNAYSIGDEFIYNDVLYRTTAAIAVGDTIVPNTNCAATNVMTEIKDLNTALSNPIESGEASISGGAGSYGHAINIGSHTLFLVKGATASTQGFVGVLTGDGKIWFNGVANDSGGNAVPIVGAITISDGSVVCTDTSGLTALGAIYPINLV